MKTQSPPSQNEMNFDPKIQRNIQQYLPYQRTKLLSNEERKNEWILLAIRSECEIEGRKKNIIPNVAEIGLVCNVSTKCVGEIRNL